MGTLATWQLSVKGMMASLPKSLNNEGERKAKKKTQTNASDTVVSHSYWLRENLPNFLRGHVVKEKEVMALLWKK